MLPSRTSTKLIELLQETLLRTRHEHPAIQPILATDADGTLWTGDVGEESFVRALHLRTLKPAVVDPLRAFARTYGVQEHEDPHEQAHALYLAHTRGLLPERETYMLAAWIFTGFSVEEMTTFADELVNDRNTSCHHEEMLPILEWAQQEQVPVWVVSASPQIVVEQAAARLSIPKHRVLAMRPIVQEGLLAPGIDGPPTYAEGKADALRLAIPNLNVLAAFGDNTFDVRMFHTSKIPVAVRPKQALLNHPELPKSTVLLVPLISSPTHRACCAPIPRDHSRCSVVDLHAIQANQAHHTQGTALLLAVSPLPPMQPFVAPLLPRAGATLQERVLVCLHDLSSLPLLPAYTSGALRRLPPL